MKSFCAKLPFKITNKKIGQKMAKSRGVQMTPPLPLRVTIFSLPVGGLIDSTDSILLVYENIRGYITFFANGIRYFSMLYGVMTN